ncbi:MAG: hypothetical protein D6711_11395 [Chloroflexi bacterium]|nr:MAG: hypothetical protein D6711_11395 [Chloroflexota bacterium]
MTISTSSNNTPPLTNRVVAFLCNVYLISMVSYLILRLIFTDTTWWLALLNAFAIYTFSPILVLLPIAFMLRLWQTAGRLSILALLGVIWFGPFFQPPHTQLPSGGTVLTLVTFNAWGNNNTQPDQAVDWLMQQDADIILLQEYTPLIGEKLDYPEHAMNAGLHLFSRYPIVESSDVNGHQRVVLDINEQQIAIYHVHLAYPLDHPPRFELPLLRTISRYDETERNQQIKALLQTLKDETLPFIVGGDFNMSQHSLIYSDLALLMGDSFRSTNTGLGATWSTQMPFPTLRLDYIWHQRTIHALKTNVGPNLGSDHLPLVAWLELPTTTPVQQD